MKKQTNIQNHIDDGLRITDFQIALLNALKDWKRNTYIGRKQTGNNIEIDKMQKEQKVNSRSKQNKQKIFRKRITRWEAVIETEEN